MKSVLFVFVFGLVALVVSACGSGHKLVRTETRLQDGKPYEYKLMDECEGECGEVPRNTQGNDPVRAVPQSGGTTQSFPSVSVAAVELDRQANELDRKALDKDAQSLKSKGSKSKAYRQQALDYRQLAAELRHKAAELRSQPQGMASQPVVVVQQQVQQPTVYRSGYSGPRVHLHLGVNAVRRYGYGRSYRPRSYRRW